MSAELKGFTRIADFNEVAPVGGRVAAHVRAADPFFKLQEQEAGIAMGLNGLHR